MLGWAIARVLLRFDDERHWLRSAPKLIGHLFPRLLRQPASGTAVVADKDLPGEETEEFFTSDDLQLTLVRPVRKDELPMSWPST